jgi:enoyl-CoA hydratase/carnithine racemase
LKRIAGIVRIVRRTDMAAERAFDEYATRYEHVVMSRDDLGVLEIRLHTDGGPMVWGKGPHTELPYCFADVAADRANRVVVLTGTGGHFIGRIDDSWVGTMDAQKWDVIMHHGARLLHNLLDIDVPMVAAVDGKATMHAELALLCDIVVASETAVFADRIHLPSGFVAGDGVHLVWPLLLGPNRGRHFLLTGRRLSAGEALDLGIVAEVVPSEALLSRAHDVARDLAAQSDIALRYTRQAITHELKEQLLPHLKLGLALEGLGAHAWWPEA